MSRKDPLRRLEKDWYEPVRLHHLSKKGQRILLAMAKKAGANQKKEPPAKPDRNWRRKPGAGQLELPL